MESATGALCGVEGTAMENAIGTAANAMAPTIQTHPGSTCRVPDMLHGSAAGARFLTGSGSLGRVSGRYVDPTSPRA